MTVGLMLITSPSMGGYSVDVYIDNVLFNTVNDNGPGDANGAVGDILYNFNLSDAQNRWDATGVLIAEGGYNGQPPASTIVTDTLIEKVADVNGSSTGQS
jgi:hypothetical protein